MRLLQSPLLCVGQHSTFDVFVLLLLIFLCCHLFFCCLNMKQTLPLFDSLCLCSFFLFHFRLQPPCQHHEVAPTRSQLLPVTVCPFPLDPFHQLSLQPITAHSPFSPFLLLCFPCILGSHALSSDFAHNPFLMMFVFGLNISFEHACVSVL